MTDSIPLPSLASNAATPPHPNPAATPEQVAQWQSAGVQAFEQVVSQTPGFRRRQGQHDMAELVAHTLARGDLGEHAEPQRCIAVIQAGTGVGKSAAYAAPAIALALARKTRVIIATATVALQEQLMLKDLPALARSLPQPFAYTLAKGRGRYVCLLKLDRFAGTGAGEDDWFEEERQALSQGQQEEEDMRRQHLFERMAHLIATGQWNGDRDLLAEPPDPRDWSVVAAERHTCTVRHCPRFKDCSYYQARAQLAESQVIVANHDLLLASLNTKALPDLSNSLLVLDEGHHLPAVALDQFSSSMDLSNLRWLDKAPKTMTEVAGRLGLEVTQDVHTLVSELKAALTTLARMAMDMVWAHTGRNSHGQGQDGTLRFANGVLPESLLESVEQIRTIASALSKSLQTLGTDIKAVAKDDPSLATMCAQQFAQLGSIAPRVGSLVSTSELLLEHGEQPLAKWLQAQSGNGFLTMTAHACPIVPGDLLRQFLWSQVRSAVVTSATLTSCGSFDFFLREAGLLGKPEVQTLEVSSPFDYARQGELQVRATQASPSDAAAYTREMVRLLMQDLESVQRGALVLFTSKAQMQAAREAIPGHLLDIVLVQGDQSRTRLLQAHTKRVADGYPSVLFGLQSFGEGLDLPGELCETVFIAKLPFASPSDPVDEARSEWLKSIGREPFMELVIPATGVRLLQWTGRAIRTEDDQARVVCYDKRLTQTAYGRRMLQGLPAYALKA
ncbi:ATP-dependent DNA helicase DinG [Curvibacter sp. CHRR-16]|uniref:ATP-dependent DNA helicase DinG n=1 Tax=Curvibacter sp. CHRR-16 TaxID=2835872 RepID=UPI001BDAC065|nr:ATP-dependent DNA helicase DinG [Curvibacter sp. CHRR-16]MBT0568944.1 ATP-dependent DNA helicase DinG [Curvibacter sp. CHRR-16]